MFSPKNVITMIKDTIEQHLRKILNHLWEQVSFLSES
jgi:hypothetical protein